MRQKWHHYDLWRSGKNSFMVQEFRIFPPPVPLTLGIPRFLPIEASAPKRPSIPTLVRLEPVIWLDSQEVPILIFGIFLSKNSFLLALHVTGSRRGSLPRKDRKNTIRVPFGDAIKPQVPDEPTLELRVAWELGLRGGGMSGPGPQTTLNSDVGLSGTCGLVGSPKAPVLVSGIFFLAEILFCLLFTLHGAEGDLCQE
jgi:hypothetical protein